MPETPDGELAQLRAIQTEKARLGFASALRLTLSNLGDPAFVKRDLELSRAIDRSIALENLDLALHVHALAPNELPRKQLVHDYLRHAELYVRPGPRDSAYLVEGDGEDASVDVYTSLDQFRQAYGANTPCADVLGGRLMADQVTRRFKLVIHRPPQADETQAQALTLSAAQPSSEGSVASRA